MSEEQATLLSGRELCSFGSGTWYDGRDAVEMMESDSPWLACKLTFDSLVVLEKKQILTHLQQLPCLEKPTNLRELLTLLEDSGEALGAIANGSSVFFSVAVALTQENFPTQLLLATPLKVKVGFSHHAIDLAKDSISSEKALCFCLDGKKDEENTGEPPKKKQKKKEKDSAKATKDSKKAG